MITLVAPGRHRQICESLGASRTSMVHVSSFTSTSEFILPFIFEHVCFKMCFETHFETRILFAPNSKSQEKLRKTVVVVITLLLYGDDKEDSSSERLPVRRKCGSSFTWLLRQDSLMVMKPELLCLMLTCNR